MTLRHQHWACELDVHDRIPGFFTDPGEAFEVFWSRRTAGDVAHAEVLTSDRVGNAAILAVNLLRAHQPGSSTTDLDPLADVVRAFDAEQQSAFAGVVAGEWRQRHGRTVPTPDRDTVSSRSQRLTAGAGGLAGVGHDAACAVHRVDGGPETRTSLDLAQPDLARLLAQRGRDPARRAAGSSRPLGPVPGPAVIEPGGGSRASPRLPASCCYAAITERERSPRASPRTCRSRRPTGRSARRAPGRPWPVRAPSPGPRHRRRRPR